MSALSVVAGLDVCWPVCNKNMEQQAAAARKGPAATPVVAASVTQQPIPLELRAIGNVEAFSAVEVKSQVSGPIANVTFQEGQEVRQGQILFEIDPRSFQQAVHEMEAEVANRKAALAQAEANYERDQAQARNARSQANRYSALDDEGIIAREQNEQSQTTALAAEKAVAASQLRDRKRKSRDSGRRGETRRRASATELCDDSGSDQRNGREPYHAKRAIS